MFVQLLAALLVLTTPQADEIGRKIWENESRGSFRGLTSWNQGEEFASMGINHFIWYPKGKQGPFEETFPGFIRYIERKGAPLPLWLSGSPPCPWSSRGAFFAEFESPKMLELRHFLHRTRALQIQFMAEQFERILPDILQAVPNEKKKQVTKNLELLSCTKKGPYLLLDYYNFKGSGLKEKERYNGMGWGLLQVLEEMEDEGKEVAYSFANAAKKVLKRRVENAPRERNEEKWLPGWLSRIKTYH